jgi:hypothetical protein
MAWSDSVVFHPWVGTNYKDGCSVSGTRLRLLLLGESHWLDKSDGRSLGSVFTCDSISSYLADKGTPGRRWSPAPYWTRTGKVVAGPDSYDRQAFWNSIAFYNHIQSFQEKRGCPPEDEWKSARPALKEVVGDLEPDAVVVLSKRLWKRVRDVIGDRGVPVNHPSSYGFSYAWWHPTIARGLARIGASRS